MVEWSEIGFGSGVYYVNGYRFGFGWGFAILLKTMLKTLKSEDFVVEKCVENLLKDFGGYGGVLGVVRLDW